MAHQLCPRGCAVSGRICGATPKVSLPDDLPCRCPCGGGLGWAQCRSRAAVSYWQRATEAAPIRAVLLLIQRVLLFPCGRTILPWFARLRREKGAEEVGVI